MINLSGNMEIVLIDFSKIHYVPNLLGNIANFGIDFQCTRQRSFRRAILCLDWQISCDQPSLRCTFRPDSLSQYQDELAYSLCFLRYHPRCRISREGSQDQGRRAREMACWRRDLSHSQKYIAAWKSNEYSQIYVQWVGFLLGLT